MADKSWSSVDETESRTFSQNERSLVGGNRDFRDARRSSVAVSFKTHGVFRPVVGCMAQGLEQLLRFGQGRASADGKLREDV